MFNAQPDIGLLHKGFHMSLLVSRVLKNDQTKDMLTLISIYRAFKRQAAKLSLCVYYDLYAHITLAYSPGLFFYEAWLGSYTEFPKADFC